MRVRYGGGHMLSCCKQTEGGEGKLKGSVDLRFAHAVGGSSTVLPVAGGLLVVGGAVVVEMLGWRQALLLVCWQISGQESAREANGTFPQPE